MKVVSEVSSIESIVDRAVARNLEKLKSHMADIYIGRHEVHQRDHAEDDAKIGERKEER